MSINTDSTLVQPETAFQRALSAYILSLPDNKAKSRFIVEALNAGKDQDPERIHDYIKRFQDNSSQKPIARALKPLITTLEEYDAIIKTFVSADPMPSALIWGALTIVLKGLSRFVTLFEAIKKELRRLTPELQRISAYEDLYSASPRLQSLFCNSYIDMFRFWSRVHKECSRSEFNSIFRGALPCSTRKLQDIIESIEEDADEIEKEARLYEAQQARAERDASSRERDEANVERVEARKERKATKEWREIQQGDRETEKYRNVQRWLDSHSTDDSSHRKHRDNLANQLPGTGLWLTENPVYLEWQTLSGECPVVWLKADPGLGKSYLCSHVIQYLAEMCEDKSPAVAYHFFRFDQTSTDLSTLRSLAGQVFEAYWDQFKAVPQSLATLSERGCSTISLQRFLSALVKELGCKVYFLLDGLDEEPRWSEARKVLESLIQLATEFPKSVRVWCSSQYRSYIGETLEKYSVLEVTQDHVSGDIESYLQSAFPQLEDIGISSQLKADILDGLLGQAAGNFLWASLMIKSLQEHTYSPSKLKQFVERKELPHGFYDYYSRYFGKVEKSQKPLISKAFSLVAYARRPLKLQELREAIGLLESNDPVHPDPEDQPFTYSLRRLFAPLIVLDGDSNDLDNCTLRLFHSTALEFLRKNPRILNEDGETGFDITERSIADACLFNLSQSRYKALLTRPDSVQWIDHLGDPITQHQLLVYSSKYWDKHLDHIPEDGKLRSRVEDFITSSNFQTCIQVQSLFLDSQFEVFLYQGYDHSFTFLRRVFPRWLSQSTENGQKLWKDYRRFLHEWKHFLRCGHCGDLECCMVPHAGQMDRCWWGALGCDNFFSKFECRYPSYCLRVGDNSISTEQTFEGVSPAGDETRLLRLQHQNDGVLVFICEHYAYNKEGLPVLRESQTITTSDRLTKWSLYAELGRSSEKSTSKLEFGRALAAAFTEDCSVLRIGVQLFTRSADDDYVPLTGYDATIEQHPSYIEDVDSNDRYTVIASRRKIVENEEQDGESDEDSCSESDLEEDDGLSTYDSFSDCSSSDSHYDSDLEDDLATPWAPYVDKVDGSNSSSDSDDSEDKDAGEGNDSGSEASDLDVLAVTGWGRIMNDEDEDENFWRYYMRPNLGDDDLEIPDDANKDSKADTKKSEDRPKFDERMEAILTVYENGGPESQPVKIFRYKRPVYVMLYESPPVLHPTESLVVWPSSGGSIVFADFVNRTYFVRKIRPSTSHTRHIFMKCRFSSCGSYLHVASLEGQSKPPPRRAGMPKTKPSDSPEQQQELKLALLVSTHRLCKRQPTKGLPTLIHRVRVDLGTETALSASTLPYTLTWTEKEVYLTKSDHVLNVHRIQLFRDRDQVGVDVASVSRNAVRRPKKDVLLPDTARLRKVYYFPASGIEGESETVARVLVGSERKRKLPELPEKTKEDDLDWNNFLAIQKSLASPVGCTLKEDKDLGGWVRSADATSIPERMGTGRLDQLLELFNPDDDCDLEPYIFA